MKHHVIPMLLFTGLCFKAGIDYYNVPVYVEMVTATTNASSIVCRSPQSAAFTWETSRLPGLSKVLLIGGLNFTGLFACNNTIVIGGCENDELGTWGVYYIKRNLYFCRRNYFCHTLFMYNIEGTLCRNDSSALADMRDVPVKCVCHMLAQ